MVYLSAVSTVFHSVEMMVGWMAGKMGFEKVSRWVVSMVDLKAGWMADARVD